MSRDPRPAFGRRNTASARPPRMQVAAPPPQPALSSTTVMLLAEISVAGTLIVVILAAIAAHAASLGDAVRMLTAMTRIEVLALTAGIAVPWVILRSLLGLPMPQFRAKPQPTIDALMLDPAPLADDGGDQPDDGRDPQPQLQPR